MHRPVLRLLVALLLALGLIPLGAAAASASSYVVSGQVTGRTATGTVAPVADTFMNFYNASGTYIDVYPGADGRFSATLPDAGPWTMWTSCQNACTDFVDEYWDNSTDESGSTPITVSSGTNFVADVQLARWGTVTGKVVDGDGVGVPAVSVDAGYLDGNRVATTTAADGTYTLDGVMPGNRSITVRDDSGQHLIDYAGQDVTVAEGPAATTLNFTVARSVGILVTVKNADGVALPNIETASWLNDPTFGWRQEWSPRTDENGRAWLPGEVGKTYRACVSDTYYTSGNESPWTPPLRYTDTCVGGATRDAAADIALTSANTRPAYTLTLAVAGQSLAPQSPWIVGLQRPGKTVSVDPGAWAPSAVALSYQWVEEDYQSPTLYREIPGATGPSYVIPSDTEAYRLGVRVRGTLSGYRTADWVSWTGPLGVPAPSVASPLKITGTQAAGSTLTASHGAVTPGSALVSYHWLVDGVEQATWGDTFELDATTAAEQISVRMRIWAEDSYGERRYVTGTGSVFTTTPNPTVNPTAVVGKALTANTGTWAPVPDSFTYQWRRVASNGAVTPIAGATAKTYTPVAADAGLRLQVATTASKSGHVARTTYSNPTAAVLQGFTTAPTPTRSGTTIVGKTLTGSVGGTWSPTPDSLTYQWLRDGVAIPGATSLTYVLTSADQGHYLRFRVTATKAGYATTAKTSSQTAAIRGVFTTVAPTVTGTKTVGSTLTAATGTWTPTPDAVTYKWLRVDSAGVATTISGATAASYVLTAADRGYKIRVTVTGTKTGYATASRSSVLTTTIS